MKTARHVATGRIVNASQVEYGDYFGIFECPQCNAALTLCRKYNRSDGIAIGATFKHPANGSEEQEACSLRVDLNFNDSSSNSLPNNLSPRGQFYRLLQENLLDNLHTHSRVDVLQYYRHYGGSWNELKSVSPFVSLSNSVLKLSQNGGYLLDYRKIIEIDLEREYANRVIWCIQFLINEANDHFRKRAIEFILGKYALQSSLEIISSGKKVSKIFGFSLKTLQSVQKIVSEESLVSEFYTHMYQGLNSSENIDQETFERMKRFQNRLLKWVIDYFIDFNWSLFGYR